MKGIRLHDLSLLIICAFFSSGMAKFQCPAAEDIYPCVCRPHPFAAGIKCFGAPGLSQVQAALSDHFDVDEPLPRLQLRNVHTLSLPPRALGDLSPRRLYLEDSNIRSIDDDAFEGQDRLGLLVLADDRLEDIPVEPLKRLKGLQTLSLAGNFLMRVQEESLSNLITLRFLVLADNRISKIDRTAFPTNLLSLSLSRNHLRTLNGSLQRLGHLEQLIIADNRLTSIRGEFEGLGDNFKYLFLDRNQIQDVSDGLESLTSLTDLSLSGNRITDIPKSSLSSLKKLKVLNLSHNYITELNGKAFEKMEDLEVLDLSGNYLKVVCLVLKPLKKLRELNLSDLSLKRLDLGCFGDMKTLKNLDLSHNHLTGVNSVFYQLLPSLAYVNMSYNRLTALSYGLGAAKNLRELDISFNHFSSMKAHHLATNRELVTLRVEGNPWKCTNYLSHMLWELEQDHINIQGRPNC